MVLNPSECSVRTALKGFAGWATRPVGLQVITPGTKIRAVEAALIRSGWIWRLDDGAVEWDSRRHTVWRRLLTVFRTGAYAAYITTGSLP